MALRRGKGALQRLSVAAAQYVRSAERQSQLDNAVRAGSLTVGRNTYGTPTIHQYKGSESRVTIGSFCSISPGVLIITGGIHPVDWVSTFPFRIRWQLHGAYTDGTPSSKGDVVIGSDVWIGTEALILSGVEIGDGAVIAARSVVTTDVPPYAIVAGNPGTVLRLRFIEEQILALLEIRWWEWPEERISEAVELLSSEGISEFIERYRGS